MNIEQLAIQADVIYADDKVTQWKTYNNAIEVLDRFAQLVIEQYKKDIKNV